VALVIEGDRDLGEAVGRQRLDVGGAEAEDRLERRALRVVELGLVGAQPASLNEGLLAVGPDFADRRLEVYVGRGRADPDVEGARVGP